MTRLSVRKSRVSATAALEATAQPWGYRSAASELALRAFSAILGVLATSFAARALDPDKFGTYFLVTTCVSVIATLAEMASRPAMLRDMSANLAPDEFGRYIFSRSVIASVAALALLACFLPFSGSAIEATAITLIVLTMFCTPFTAQSVILHAANRGDKVGLGVTLQSVIQTSILGLNYFYGGGLVGVAVSLLLSTSFLGAYYRHTARQIITPRKARIWWRPRGATRSESVWATATGAFNLLAWKVDVPVIYSIAGATANGLYAASYRFLDTLMLLPTVFSSAYAPRLSQGNRSDATRVLLAALSLSATAGLLVGAAAGPLCSVVYGAAYSEAPSILRILVVCLPLVVLRYAIAAELVQKGHFRLAALNSLGYTALSVASVIVLTLRFGVIGAGFATVFAEAAFGTLILFTSRGRRVVKSVSSGFLLGYALAGGLLCLAVWWNHG